MITLRHVDKSFRLPKGRKYVLRDVSVSLPKRNIGILGASGAGKSTLLRLISGQAAPDRGVIRREGSVSWPLGFGGVFNGSLSGAENTQFIARIYGKDPEEVMEFVKDFSELGEFFRMPVCSYSSGMRAKLAFGASMAIDFDTYLIDEITAVGDAGFRAKCHAMFKGKLASASIIMVSHSMKTIRDYCDMGGLIAGGDLMLYDDVRHAIRAYQRGLGADELDATEDD